MNIAPDQSGRIRENEANTIIALNKDRLHIEPGKPLPTGGKLLSLEAKAEASSVYEDNEALYGARYAETAACRRAGQLPTRRPN